MIDICSKCGRESRIASKGLCMSCYTYSKRDKNKQREYFKKYIKIHPIKFYESMIKHWTKKLEEAKATEKITGENQNE